MRLIDADKLLERMKKGMESGSNLNGTFDLYIEHAPTEKPTGDLINRQDAIDTVEELNRKVNDGREFDTICTSDVIRRINVLPSADRPTGEIDAVAIYEKSEHDLEHGRITLGEFEKRIEPLKHLWYDRPTGEWINREKCQVDEDAYEIAICSECGAEITLEYSYDSFCPNCGAKMGGEEE